MREYPNRPQRGFSLLEILTGLAIISIVLAMGMLNYSTILARITRPTRPWTQLLYQLRSARETGHLSSPRGQVQFGGTNQFTVTELWLVGYGASGNHCVFRRRGSVHSFSTIPDLPAPFNFGNTAAVYFGGVSGGPPVMKFSTTGSFIDGGNTLVNGTVFMGIPGKPSTARAISVLGATGRVREYHWDGTQWQE